MNRKSKNNDGIYHYIAIAIYANLTIATLIAAGLIHRYLFKKPIPEVLYYFGAIFIWALLAYIIESIRRDAKAEIVRLKTIIEGLPHAKIIEQIIDPATRKDGFEALLSQMDNMSDRDLALIAGSIRYHAGDIVKLAENGENYNLFREIIEKLSSYDIGGRTQTFESLLWVLSDIYNMEPPSDSRRQIQKDMIESLKNVLCRADEAHLSAIRAVIEKIMLDSKDDHDLARPILETLSTLDPKSQEPSWQVVFDQCKRRALRFPESFGYEFIDKVGELGYKVFWLDFHSLRDIWIEMPPPSRKGLIVSNQAKFDQLCSKVFAAVEEPQYSGNRHGRVFRRVKADNGKVKIECVTPDGETCDCEGESLSFRGIYSSKCQREAAERLQAKITPILEQNRQFNLNASVAKVHTDQWGNPVQGRGIFFDDADQDVAEELYQYISQH